MPKLTDDQLREAARLLDENDLWQGALDEIIADYHRQWATSEPALQTHRENAYFMVQAVEKLRTQIKTYCNAGSLSKQVSQNNVKPKK